MDKFGQSNRDFPEDFEHENGMYYCNCRVCGQHFIGYKRRVVCKVCVGELVKGAESPPSSPAAMDKVSKHDLARLIGSLEAYAKTAKPESQWMPQTVFALLDELERAAERNVALGAELEQCRKDAERYRRYRLGKVSPELLDSSIDAAMTKEGGANG